MQSQKKRKCSSQNVEGTTGKHRHIVRRARNPTISMAMGHIAPGDEVVELSLNVRGKAKKRHTVSGIKTTCTASIGW